MYIISILNMIKLEYMQNWMFVAYETGAICLRIQLPLFMQAMYLVVSLDQLFTVGSLSLIQSQVLP